MPSSQQQQHDVPGHQSARPTCPTYRALIVLHWSTGMTKKYMHIYIPMWGSGVIGLKNNFSGVNKSPKFGFWTIKGSIHPGYFIQVVPNEIKERVIIIRNYGATKNL